ncbi:MAG: ParB-like nuclease domain protein [Firmicutes bacterium ADurb.Bin506]|nr:MAG: ParB-like nuclease domain protein [Firmicutes bacterium ADurb.Bin506]
MEIREMPLEQLLPADYNPRVALSPGDPEFERLKNSIETFGEVAPIVWNQRTGRIVGGHQRLAVYYHLGRKTASVSIVDISEKEEKLLNVALNKIKGQWDYSKLEEILGDYEIEEAKASGFSAQEIALILARNDDLDDPDEFEEEPDDFIGASWVVTLSFDRAADARAWAEAHGHKGAVKKGAKTTVIRMD